jgi:hypothetical protein
MEWLAGVLTVGGILFLIIKYPDKAKSFAKYSFWLILFLYAAYGLYEKYDNWKISRIWINVTYDPYECPGAAPLKTVIHNTASTDVLRTFFYVEGLAEGHSEPGYGGSFDTDRIIKANQIITQCFPMPTAYSSRNTSLIGMKWTAKPTTVRV